MLLIRVIGWPSAAQNASLSFGWAGIMEKEVCDALKKDAILMLSLRHHLCAACTAAVPSIPSDTIVVSFDVGSSCAEGDLGTFTIICEELTALPDVTPSHHEQLAQAIRAAVRERCKIGHLHPETREYQELFPTVIVIVRPFNTETGAYRTD